ncbi:PREDICTED: nuclear-pore anchor-like isoform X3 [Camelina sativa]|uniref:Nuclear-pore anchor-like isoform X3 n=1 Tax=Camelina sativa TaxID=90675 RepID=A0ABM0TQN7_CAMSA|nr:PREDICTED: nuclear-pore anchor-like isoform X3 [Camelina sativa]
MPLFMPDEELARLSSDAASVVAERADEYIRKIYADLDSVRAKADAASITAEQTCSLLEQKYLSLSQDFSSLESQNAKLQSDLDDRLAELAQSQAQKHQLHLQSIEKDGEVERMTAEMSELHKSKRQLMDLLEQKDAEISEKNSTIKSYLDKIVKLTDSSSEKEARLAEANAELARSQAMCSRLSQEKELTERHAKWLDEELTAKVDSYAELRRRHSDLEADMSAKLVDAERNYNECSSSLNWHKQRLRELETKISSLQEDLSSCKDVATTTEEQYNAELHTANKLVELYKESSEEWSRKAGELEGVIKALEERLSQVENSYKDRLEKEVSTKQLLEKENEDLKQKLEKCETEIEKSRKVDELNLIPFSSFIRRGDDCGTSSMIEESQAVISKVPAGVSGTALAASLLRDGWSLAKIYEKYQEAVDALRHEQLGRKEAEMILQRVLSELEEKAGFIQEERGEYERMVEAYSLVNQKLQDSVSEQSKMEKFIMELKADLRRRERENTAFQKDISDLQKQVTILLKECRDVQLRCGAARDDDDDEDYPLLSDVEMDVESEADKIISEHLLKFRDINGLVEQNVKLRSLARCLSEEIESREMELKEKFEIDLKDKTDEASAKVATVLKRAEEQGQMIESLHASVAMYKRLYEEEQKLHSSDSRSSELSPAVVPGKNFLHLLEDSEEATKRAQEKAFERIRSLEEDFAKARSEIIAVRSERDKLAMEANFAKEKLEGIMKESERKREEMNGVLARNIEFSQLIIDHQRKLRESSESLHAAEEICRKLSMEVSVLKQEKEVLSNAEKRASDEVSALSQRVYRLQATLDTVQSTEEVREEARAAERRKQEEHIKQLEREWAEAKKELQDERSSARSITSDSNQTLNKAVMQVEEMGKELADSLKAVSVAESRASVAEARLSDLEKKIRASDPKVLDMDNGGIISLSDNEMSVELRIAKEEIEKLRGDVESSKSHMLQYKSIAQVNETALKQMESAHENFRLEAEKRQRSLEAELVAFRERVSELENDCIKKSEQLATAAAGKEDALVSASAEIASLREESLVKNSQMEAVNIQMSILKNELEMEHEKWRVAQRNYERQVILQSETIQELTKTSQALAALQEEASELRKLADARGIEISELNSKWSEQKLMLEQQKNLAEKKYHELNEQNKLLHSRLEAKHLNSAEKDSRSGKILSGSTDTDQPEDSGLQSVVNYLRRTKEIAETEISLMRQEKLRLQSQLESALKMAESARESLKAERASTRASLLTEDGIKSLQLQVSEMSLLRESNMQLREENKHNFEECQRLREVAQKARMESEDFENLLKKKQTELELCMKEMERLRMETDLQKKRVDELRETYRNIDVADYNRLKDEVRQLEEKMKVKDAHVEDFKKLLLEKQNKISLLEKELTNCKKDLSEREKRLDDAQQAQATMQSEFNKQKQELEKFKRAYSSLNTTKRKYEKEKEDLNKVNQSLSKQLDEAKEAGKRTTTDAMVEQAVKEREEKEHRIQFMDKYVHTLKEEVKKKTEDLKKKDEELTKERTERKSVEKEVGDSLTKIKKEKTKVDEEFAKLERYQTALAHLSEELEKLKQADGNLPEGTAAVQVLSGSILNDKAAAYVSAVEYFERVARSIAINSQVSTKPTEPSSVESSAIARAPSSTPLKAPVATTQQPPKVATENKEKRSTLQKSSTEVRRPGSSRRIIRPQLVKPEESPQVDVDMPEAEGAGDDGKQSAAHETESQVTTSVRPVCKRQSESLVPEPQLESLIRGETSSEIVPPASKKAKISESQPSESQPDASEGENLSKEPAIEESMDATTAADGDNEETEAENAEEESVEAQQENEAEVQDKADEPVEENPTETETILTEEESRDQTEQENQELTDMESDKEEGELDLDTLEDLDEATDIANMMRSPEKEEVQPETLATPTQSPTRMVTAIEEAETTTETPLEDDKTDEGGDAAEEASDKPNYANDQQEVPETDLKPETTAATTFPASTAPTASSTQASAITSSGAPETEETKRAASPGGESSTMVTLSVRAKLKREERIASLGGTARAPNPAVRGRGRAPRGRFLSRGGRAPRGGPQ